MSPSGTLFTDAKEVTMFDNGITLTVGDTQEYLNKIRRNMIGFDDWISDFDSHFKNSNYPPYNTIKISNHEYKVEVALAGFKKDELKVYTQEGKLVIEGAKTEKEDTDYVHRGLAQRSFTRQWALPDDLVVKKVDFEDGLLLVDIQRIIPEHQQRKEWL